MKILLILLVYTAEFKRMVLFLAVVCSTSSGIPDTACAKDSDCEASLSNSYCEIISPCKKGRCACSDGYSGHDCQSVGYDKPCNTGTDDKCDSDIGLVCDPTSRKCVCSRSDQTYKTEVIQCTDKNLFGENCKYVTDCYVGSNDDGACTDSKCSCAKGFVKEMGIPGHQRCRQPYASEKGCASTCGETECTSTCGTFPNLFLREDNSLTLPTCTNIKCSCAGKGESMHSVLFRKLCVGYCLTDLSSDEQERDIGAICTASNQCKSKFCSQCPGDDQGICYDAPCKKEISDGSRIEENVITHCLSMVLYFLSLLTW